MSFPCVFSKYGCSDILLFGKTAEHECKCVHKPFRCPTNSFEACAWEGSTAHLLKHFKDFHPNFVKVKTEFQLKLTEDTQGFLMLVQKSLPFIIKYSYKAKEQSLWYDVRNCGNKNGAAVLWKTQLINATDLECNLNLKSNECLSYDETFCGVQNDKVLDLSKFLESLDNPDSIIVALNFKIAELNCNGVTVDRKAIENLKCNVCCNYLVPPLFYLKGKTICHDCSKTNPTCTPCINLNLLRLVNNAIYPCRWRECKFVVNSNLFKDHIKNCKFRMTLCVYSDCEVPFRFCAAADHFKTHKNKCAVYMPNKLTYKTSFAEDYECKDIFTSIKNDKPMVFEHKMVSHNSERTHEMRLHRFDCHYTITGVVHFEHMHCTLTKKFEISNSASLQVTLNKLPPCFKKTDELTVTADFL